jgi:putative nucleotidyltransferase with HDIG domain
MMKTILWSFFLYAPFSLSWQRYRTAYDGKNREYSGIQGLFCGNIWFLNRYDLRMMNVISLAVHPLFMERDDAILLLRKHVEKESLIAHCRATAAIMRATAEALGKDADLWEVIGILHDIDYEEVDGDMGRHGDVGADLLRAAGFGEEVAGPVQRHNYRKYRDAGNLVDASLTAADNISGLIIACAMVKGGSLSDVTAKTVKKKMKERAFAAGCNRERILKIEPYMELSAYYTLSVAALQGIRGDLGLT